MCFPYPDATDQGNAVSCVAHAMATALYCEKARRGLLLLPESRAFAPATAEVFERALVRSADPSRGTSFRGVVREILEFHGEDMRALGCWPLFLSNDVKTLKDHIESGSPVVAGYQVSEEIDLFHRSAKDCARRGFVLPPFSGKAISAHCVLLMGWDEAVRCFLARNSWGAQWGVDGHFLVGFDSVADRRFFTDLLILAQQDEVRKRPQPRPARPQGVFNPGQSALGCHPVRLGHFGKCQSNATKWFDAAGGAGFGTLS